MGSFKPLDFGRQSDTGFWSGDAQCWSLRAPQVLVLCLEDSVWNPWGMVPQFMATWSGQTWKKTWWTKGFGGAKPIFSDCFEGSQNYQNYHYQPEWCYTTRVIFSTFEVPKNCYVCYVLCIPSWKWPNSTHYAMDVYVYICIYTARPCVLPGSLQGRSRQISWWWWWLKIFNECRSSTGWEN